MAHLRAAHRLPVPFFADAQAPAKNGDDYYSAASAAS
ncbi:hypothetical protein JOF57_002154 [Mycolicibacterium lutetiense]|uniref:Uncharacterized protein n=1 Tax=Mycolicibacterium lutetiense TaxID=1641992 RepID=A0ABS4ZRV7_9MYCO|nr:hypothetical protein [Mycolicibacterium lutetiense]